MRHLVVGAGEVGTAVHAVLSRTHPTQIRDIDPVDVDTDVLDVCIPWSAKFPEIVHGYAAKHSASLVVVHSTVPVGTCDTHGWVHSPIRGRHPDLTPGVATFAKHFGGERADEAATDWKQCGVPVVTHPRAADTEAGKLWELAQYGLQIRVEKAMHAWCEQQGLDPDVVYTAMAHTYNTGYQALGHEHFTRPVLEHVDGDIGGHCVIPMSHLLDHPIAAIVREGFNNTPRACPRLSTGAPSTRGAPANHTPGGNMATSRTGTTRYQAWRRQVLRAGRQNGVDHCPTCGVHLDYSQGRRPNSAEPDHIVPYSLGGRDTRDNGRVLCRRCNQSRGNGTRRPGRRPKTQVQTIDFGTLGAQDDDPRGEAPRPRVRPYPVA